MLDKEATYYFSKDEIDEVLSQFLRLNNLEMIGKGKFNYENNELLNIEVRIKPKKPYISGPGGRD